MNENKFSESLGLTNGIDSQTKIEEIFKNLRDCIDEIKDDAMNSGKKDDASSSISFIGMILDEISNSLKKGNLKDINKVTVDLDDKIKTKLNGLNPFISEKIVTGKLDDLAVYCDKVFMELMAGVSCAIPENIPLD